MEIESCGTALTELFDQSFWGSSLKDFCKFGVTYGAAFAAKKTKENKNLMDYMYWSLVLSAFAIIRRLN